MVDAHVNGTRYCLIESLPQPPCNPHGTSGSMFFMEPHFFVTVTRSAADRSGEIIYSIEISEATRLEVDDGQLIAKGTVVAPIGQDATLTFSNDHGEFTITFFSRI